MRIAVVLSVLAALLGAPSARADTLLAGPRTPGCEQAPLWKLGYRLYWVDDQGRTAYRADQAILDHAREFTATVGVDCVVRVQVDVYDERSAPWPATTSESGYPTDTQAFQRRHGYDAVINRFPARGDEPYSGISEGQRPDHFLSKFPGAPTPLTAWGTVEPTADVLWHEWLHLVVAYYTPRQGWPQDDVHGACTHGYGCEGISEPYFADLMRGRVTENQAPKGLLPAEWTYYGTPTRPRHQRPGVFLKIARDGGNAGWQPGVARVVLTYTNVHTGHRAYRKDITRRRRSPPMWPSVPAGLYDVCLTSTASLRYRPDRACQRYRVAYDSAQASNWRLAHP